MIQLRDYQLQAVRDLRTALRSSTSVLMVLGTGGGKTVIASAIVGAFARAGKRVMFLVHRRDLVKQTAQTFDAADIDFGYISAGKKYVPGKTVYIGTIGTVVNRLEKFQPDLVFVDEAHLSMSATWNKVVQHYRKSGAIVIGLTASPKRLDGRPLGDNFQAMVLGPSVADMIAQGNLSTYKVFSPSCLDLTGVRTRCGDFVSSDVEALMEGKAVMSDAVRHWQNHAYGKRTIAFCVSVETANRLAEEFNAQGINAAAVTSETPDDLRAEIFERFADCDIEVITSVNLFCEGFDLSAQVGRDITVEAVMLHRPTKSEALHLQQVGRALRRKPYSAIILDLVGNIFRHGFPDDERDWSLEGKKKKSSIGPAIKTCTNCYATHPSAAVCPECGHVYPVSTGGPRTVEEIEVEMKEIDVEAIRRKRKRELTNAKTEADLIALGRERGYKYPEGWAKHIMKQRAEYAAQHSYRPYQRIINDRTSQRYA